MKKMKIATPYILALLICLFVSFPAVSNSIVLDEAYTLGLIRGSISEIIRGAASDVHPLLYYLILKLSDLFGSESLFKYRIVTAMGTYLNLLLVGATMVRKQWGCRVSVLYILWFGLTYGTLEKSTFVRMYSWGAFFVTSAAVLLYTYYNHVLCLAVFISGSIHKEKERHKIYFPWRVHSYDRIFTLAGGICITKQASSGKLLDDRL